MPESSNKGGRKPRVTDEEVLDVFRSTSDPVLSTAEVAEQLPIKRRGTLNRLRSLEDRDALESKQIGGRNTVWWFTPGAGAREPTDSLRGKPQATPEDSSERTSQTPPKLEFNPSRESGPYSDLSFPKDRQECITAINAVVSYLEEHGPASMRTIVTDVMPDYPIGYDVPELKEGERYRGSWWRKIIKPGLEAHDAVKKPAKGASEWRYTGEA